MWFILTLIFSAILAVLCSRRVAGDIARALLFLTEIASCHSEALYAYYDVFKSEYKKLREKEV